MGKLYAEAESLGKLSEIYRFAFERLKGVVKNMEL